MRELSYNLRQDPGKLDSMFFGTEKSYLNEEKLEIKKEEIDFAFFVLESIFLFEHLQFVLNFEVHSLILVIVFGLKIETLL